MSNTDKSKQTACAGGEAAASSSRTVGGADYSRNGGFSSSRGRGGTRQASGFGSRETTKVKKQRTRDEITSPYTVAGEIAALLQSLSYSDKVLALNLVGRGLNLDGGLSLRRPEPKGSGRSSQQLNRDTIVLRDQVTGAPGGKKEKARAKAVSTHTEPVAKLVSAYDKIKKVVRKRVKELGLPKGSSLSAAANAEDRDLSRRINEARDALRSAKTAEKELVKGASKPSNKRKLGGKEDEESLARTTGSAGNRLSKRTPSAAGISGALGAMDLTANPGICDVEM